MSTDELWALGLQSIKELEAERGILASSRSEVYGCIFGRDSLITSLFLLKVYRQKGDRYFLDLVKKTLLNLAALQGRVVNIESGEEPGKCIHEYRTDHHEHLTKAPREPWYLYEDGFMRNYDSVDATPLFLMALSDYLTLVPGDTELFFEAARAALSWLREYGDSNGDGLIDYRFPPGRVHGGLKVQSWMDSGESLFFEHAPHKPAYAIAPVEVQAYAYVALKNWARHFALRDALYAQELMLAAEELKKRFTEAFVLRHGKTVSLAYAVDGAGRRLTSARSSMAHVLWAVDWENGTPDSILEASLVPSVVRRLLSPDLYVPSAGIRTLSTRSRHFDALSYHNGSIWPHDTAMFAEGLENFAYQAEARRVRMSLMRSYAHFRTPIELFGYSRGFQAYRNACQIQAWSAASILSNILGLAPPGEAMSAPIAPSIVQSASKPG